MPSLAFVSSLQLGVTSLARGWRHLIGVGPIVVDLTALLVCDLSWIVLPRWMLGNAARWARVGHVVNRAHHLATQEAGLNTNPL